MTGVIKPVDIRKIFQLIFKKLINQFYLFNPGIKTHKASVIYHIIS